MTDVPGWVLPGELAGRRTGRDWVVDVVSFGGAVVLGLVVFGYAARYERPLAVDLPLGALACLSLWWRRRFPLAVALLAVPALAVPALAVASSSFGAGMMIVLNLALRVPWRRSLPVLCLYLVAAVPDALRGGDWLVVAFAFAYYLVFFAWGSALRARRLLVLKLREDAERERADHARRLADTRRAEREAIAGEMHDVLAHRISLLSVHAGALAYRTKQSEAGAGPALSGTEVAESAQIIRGNAHQALDELHELLVVLRADDDPKPPRVADIAGLVEEARTAGQPVDFHSELDVEPADAQLRRTAYRVVQEGLTNARKHAYGSRVSVRLAGGPGAELTVEVGYPLPSRASVAEIPGAGAGLTGLAERVARVGGTLEFGGVDGGFEVRARLPWPP